MTMTVAVMFFLRMKGGLVLGLTDVEGNVDIDTLLARETAPKEPGVPKELPTRDMAYYVSILDKMGQTQCDECGQGIYGHSKKWIGRRVCVACHADLRKGISSEFQVYLDAIYGAGCTFCGKMDGRFHLDHINMFSKTESVCDMLDRGCDEAIIREEIGKCQLLCVPCHTIVTRYEQMAGFHADKKALNKRKIGKEERRQELYAKYEGIMAVIYPRLRELGAGRVANG